MRQVLWKRYAQAFRAGQHVLDVGCGTGTDALFLAQHGVRVTAIDISPSMVAQAEEKVASHGLEDRVRVTVLRIDELSDFPAEEFDGIISSFAALNTLPNLSQFASDAARLLRPSGRMILHLLNAASLWEWANLMARGRAADARLLGRRRERTFDIGGRPVPHYMPRAKNAYEQCFAGRFQLRDVRGLGILRPPHPIGHLPEPILSALGHLDVLIGGYPHVAGWGRFVMLDMARDGTAGTV